MAVGSNLVAVTKIFYCFRMFINENFTYLGRADIVSIRRFTIAASLKPHRIGGLFPFIMHCSGRDYISDSFHYAAIAKVT